jgi:hypothetical protein
MRVQSTKNQTHQRKQFCRVQRFDGLEIMTTLSCVSRLLRRTLMDDVQFSLRIFFNMCHRTWNIIFHFSRLVNVVRPHSCVAY